MTQPIYEINVLDIDGNEVNLSTFKNKTLLIVNVASKCGFTSQYAGLEKLYKTYKDQNFEILAFPCNQFGAQEPGDAEEIKNFCSLTYDVTFKLFKKIDVNGDNTHPLFKLLKSRLPGLMGTESIKWNFTKFLVDKNGAFIKRYGPNETPSMIEKDIVKIL